MTQQEMEIDFKKLFESVPGLYLILSPDLKILDASDAYTIATLTRREEIKGRQLFEVFPDNPDDHSADGVSNLRASLNFVLQHRTSHVMAVQKYDVRRADGTFEEKYWSPVNKPVLDENNNVSYIIHRVEDVTEFMLSEKEFHARSQEMEAEIIRRSQEIQKLNQELELKVAERTSQLNELYTQHAGILNSLPAQIALVDNDGIIVAVNEAWRQFGLGNGQLAESVGQNYIQVCENALGDDRLTAQEMAGNLRRVLNGELSEFKLEYPCHSPDEQRWFRVEVRPQIAGRQSGAVIMHVNISDTKLAEQTARRATWEIWDYKYALDESSIVAVTDARGIIQHANDNFCRIAKYTRQELIGRDHRIVSSGFHSKEFIRELWQTISSGRIWKGELKNKAKDGTIYWVDTTIVPFLDEENKPYKYLAIRTDITERKRHAEEHLLNEERYRNLYENSIVAMVTYDLVKGKATEVNDMAVEVCGYESKEDFLKNFDPAIHYVHVPDRNKLLETLMREGEIKSSIFEVKRKKGANFWVKVFLKLYADRTMAQAVIIDVTQQVRYHEELEAKVESRTLELTASLQREQAMNEMKSRFVAIASHEFRTPLSTILSSVSLVAAYPKEDQAAKRNKHIERIKTSVRNLTEILNDFLSLEKLEQGKVEIVRQPIDIPQIAADLRDDLNGMLKPGQGINFGHSGDIEITLDKKILRHVLQNLLSNAIKYSGENSEITFSTSVSDGFLTITVRDEGIGIPEEEQAHLFGEFFRAKNVAGIQGTGLGLNIVKRYVELLNGIISFESRQGAGTTFTVVFPEAEADTAER